MIKIEKTDAIPERLTINGNKKTDEMKAAFIAESDKYYSGKAKFVIKNSIYGHHSVKAALKKAQNGKCCFCERKIEVGDVEHYRPKGGYQQDKDTPLNYPGYYWLAYNWQNLLLSCAVCNRSFKRNLFPLVDNTTRASSHVDDLAKEEPLIINPSIDDPEQYIEYYGYQIRAIDGNLRGRTTIEVVGLDRPFIDERRRDHYLIFKEIYKMSREEKLSKFKRTAFMQLIENAAQSHSEYAGMIRWGLRYEFPAV